MAFGGVAAFNPIQQNSKGPLALAITGQTLAANVGAFDATGAAADSGLLNSNNGAVDAVPANTTSLPTTYGPGQDNWSAEDVEALMVLLSDQGAAASILSWRVTLVANVGPAPTGKTNNNVVIGIHNKGAGAATAILAILRRLHTATL